MAKTLAIKVVIDGQQTAVKNIGQLETAIQQMREELKGVDIGSESFKKLTGQIQNAESKLKTLNKSFEGLEPQQKTEAFVKLGEGIAGSFAVATAALSAFGIESEDVQKAQLAVTQALTIAVGARQIAEATLQAQVVATTISQYAYNAAATAGNAVTKAFYTTIAANPIGALVTAIVAAAAAIYGLISAMEEEVSVQDEINDALVEAQKNTVKQELTLKSYQKVINDTNKSDEERAQALKNLKKILPELEGLELDNEDAINQVNTAIRKNITLIQQRAKAEALAQIVVEKTKALLDQQNSSLDDNISWYEKGWNYLRYTYAPGMAEVANVTTAATNSIEKQKQQQEQLQEVTEQYSAVLDDLLKLEEDANDAAEDAADAAEAAAEAEARRKKAKEELVQTLRDEISARAVLANVIQGELDTPEFLQKIQTSIKAYEDAINRAFGTDVFDDYNAAFATVSRASENTFKQLSNQVTSLGGILYDTQFVDGENGEAIVADVETKIKGLVNLLNATQDDVAKALKEGRIAQDEYDFFNGILSNYRALVTELEKEPNIFGGEADDKIAELNSLLLNLANTTQDVFEPGNFTMISASGTMKDLELLKAYQEGLLTLEEYTSRVNKERELAYGDDAVGGMLEIIPNMFEGVSVGFTKATNALEEWRQKQIDAYTKVLASTNQYKVAFSDANEREAAARKEATTRVDSIISLNNTLLQQNEQIYEVQGLSLAQNNEIYDLEQRAQAAFVVNNQQRIFDKLYEAQLTKDLINEEIDLEENKAKIIADFNKTLIDEGVNLLALSLEERQQLYDNYIEYVKKKEEEAAKTAADARKKEEYDFDDFVKDFQQSAQLSVQVFQQYVNTQLQYLQARERAILDQIVGDSEEAEAKRLEIQEEYEKKRSDLQKQGALAQLQLSRIQATANIAEAITKAFTADAILGAVFAGIIATLGAVQVGIITQQISQTRNLRRGGFLTGPSHEQGGIPLGQSGVYAEGGEVVINRQSSIDYRGLLDNISQSGGGRPIVSSPYDDSRLIEAITKQNRQPIKAYVLEQDVTSAQAVNKRLQQLSKI